MGVFLLMRAISANVKDFSYNVGVFQLMYEDVSACVYPNVGAFQQISEVF